MRRRTAGWGDCRGGLVPDSEPRDEHFELYLDDRWLFTTPIPGAPLSGDILLYAERGRASFTDLRATALSPLKRTAKVGEHHPQQ